jgi:hypothetical protein
MADRPRLANPVVHVTMSDGGQYDTVTSNADMVAFDLTRGPRKWPLPAEAPMLYQTFLAWKALTRESLIDPKTPWDAFVRDAVQVQTTRDDGDGPVPDTADVDPTRPGPGPG